MRLLLETHVLLWGHAQPARLTETASRASNDLDNAVWLRVVNGWAIQSKTQLGTRMLPKPRRVRRQEEQATNGCRVRPVTLEHGDALDRLPLPHRDPIDRLRMAQAHQEGLTRVTHDPQRAADAVSVLWERGVMQTQRQR